MLQFIIVDEIGKTESNKHRSDDKTKRVRCYLEISEEFLDKQLCVRLML